MRFVEVLNNDNLILHYYFALFDICDCGTMPNGQWCDCRLAHCRLVHAFSIGLCVTALRGMLLIINEILVLVLVMFEIVLVGTGVQRWRLATALPGQAAGLGNFTLL